MLVRMNAPAMGGFKILIKGGYVVVDCDGGGLRQGRKA